MQISVNPIGHFLRVRLCAREERGLLIAAVAIVDAAMDWLRVADNELRSASFVFRILRLTSACRQRLFRRVLLASNFLSRVPLHR